MKQSVPARLLKAAGCCIWLLASMVPVAFVSANPGLAEIQSDTVYIVQRDWHTGIVVEKTRLDSQVWQHIPVVEDVQFADVSWGDQRFYQAYRGSFWLAAQAVLWPTKAVIRTMKVSVPVKKAYPASRIIALGVKKEQYARLCDFISASFARDKQNTIIPSTGFAYSIGFYVARRKYHLFRTCNTWVALALQQAGLDIHPFGVLNANQLFRRLEHLETASYIRKL